MLGSMLSFSGRVNRGAFARGAALCWIALNVVAVFGAVPTHALDPSFPTRHVPPALLAIALPTAAAVALLVAALVLVIAIALIVASLNVRRFHDVNLSGWYVLLWTVVLSVVPMKDFGDYLPTTTDLVWYAALVTVPGSAGANRYGPSPAAARDGDPAG